MAVQKSKKSRSRRGMRRSHDALVSNVPMVEDESTACQQPVDSLFPAD